MTDIEYSRNWEEVEVYVSDQVKRSPDVAEAWSDFREALNEARLAMEQHGMIAAFSDGRTLAQVLTSDLEERAGDVMAATIREAFTKGFTTFAQLRAAREGEG